MSQSESEKMQDQLEPLGLVKTPMRPEHHVTHISTRRWDRDDTYEVVEVQVFDIPARTPVRVTVTPLTDAEYEAYMLDKTDAAGNPK